MNATFPNTTLQEELVTLIQLRISKDYQARHPATDPRLAIEAEADRAALDLKIADLTAKTQDAKILPFPTQGGGGPIRKAGLVIDDTPLRAAPTSFLTMKTTDPRDLTWQDIRGNLAGTREVVHAWLLANGPATTKAISLGTGIGLLTVRPRVSELCAWGFAEITGRLKHEGVYQAITVADAQRLHEEKRHQEAQLPLKFQ